MTRITYRRLFEHLRQIGFADLSRSEFERVFEHAERGILLVFSMMDDASVDRPLREADLTSVEFRLQQQGLLSGALADAMARVEQG